ncbi:DNA methylase [Caldovatus sediminis]|uniref:site-specific DNA-methyltransferase (adenine-specific) n=1 Tax=Caldovatus sediminis TaxID=2041189 RepID=A0A8J2ZFF4_9PROT|nr:site-specific DNA-methyltransferase [Caldovatus sediminis]GGG50666.1 DNA methylase [Caldovatus sediminis]
MPPAKKTPKPEAATEVETLRHPADVTRRNIPTAETSALMAEEEARAKPMLYPRNPDLDPQLVWRGKDALDAEPLAVPTVPIYIQEKVLPEALIRDLLRVSREGAEPQADLFGGFDRIADPETRLEFYRHAENWSNRMILGDSLLVMNSLAEKEGLRGQVQMIYLDPPFGISFASNWQPTTRSRTVGETARDLSREPEQIKAFRDTWRDGIHSYLAFWRDRLVVARELLAESGSIFVQIGEENAHRMRALLDEVFGPDCAVVTLLVKKKGSQRSTLIDPVNDYILWYGRTPRTEGRLKFRPLFEPRELDAETLDEFTLVELPDGQEVKLADLAAPDGTPTDYRLRPQRLFRDWPGARLFRSWPITNGGERPNQMDPVPYRGVLVPPPRGQCWRHPSRAAEGEVAPMQRVVMAGRLTGTTSAPGFKRYLDDFAFKTLSNWWDGLGGASRPIYVVQTNEEVVKRCVLMTTDPGDLVLDPTCGSGTTAAVAEAWGRRWITIDTSRVALALARTRLMAARHAAFLLRDSREGAAKEADLTGRPPEPGPFAGDIRQGFVLERAARITSSVVANNAEIDVIHARWQPALDAARAALNAALGTAHEEWQVPRSLPEGAPEAARASHAAFWQAKRERQAEMDASIARNAEVELLHDRPYTKRNALRVTGPFTVESLSPHRVLPADEEEAAVVEALAAEAGEAPPPRRRLRAAPAGAEDFVTAVLDNLAKAGVQNTKKNERLMFATIRPWPGKGHVAAEATWMEGDQPRRAAIVIGPEYGTVGADLVREAARECRDWADALVVCGFAFDPQVGETTMNLGRLTVLKARMSQELHAAEAYKAGGGNLFVVFGEPDIALERRPDGACVVRLKGVDIFDPTTGEVRSSRNLEEDVACWFVDTDYDGDSFFVRQAYFLGGKDPFEKLKAALKAEVDEAAWSTLRASESRPFPPPKSGRIAVKVINHYGDEAMRVFGVG